ncbi:hypothetical protein IEQ34_006470 [Dendrobium chrysotoxum]|uniref:DUF4283 domain-containing protein n=1 Tax=Dendrobium chrysotoxum TaxID=161865 RepID=A0AAV7HEV3_DENCH|nr:hypothetical protein IEQ34_006470 [Dendrobium chrysotoxum]
MKLTKWSPSLDIGIESPVIPIWISFSKLRPHLFSLSILHALGWYIQMVEIEDLSSFCDSCKCIGHVRGEYPSHASAPKTTPTITSNPHMYDGNAIRNVSVVLKTIVLDGNVVSAIDNLDNPSPSLCPIMFNNYVLINGVNDVSGVVYGLGVVVAGVDVR